MGELVGAEVVVLVVSVFDSDVVEVKVVDVLVTRVVESEVVEVEALEEILEVDEV